MVRRFVHFHARNCYQRRLDGDPRHVSVATPTREIEKVFLSFVSR
jgi:hypothetical protein